MRIQTVARWIFRIYCFSFLGLVLTKLVARALHASCSKPLRLLDAVFTTGFCVGALGILAFLPLRPRKKRILEWIRSGQLDLEKLSTWERAVFKANYADLPRWLYLPFLAVAVSLAILTALGIVGMLLWMILS